MKMDFDIFERFFTLYDNARNTANRLIETGFAIESRNVQSCYDQCEIISDILNRIMGLERNSEGYTTIDWFIENRSSDDPDLHRITLDGKAYEIWSVRDLYNFITEVES